MLIRRKLFSGLGDGFGGKRGDIKRSKIRRSASYKKFGPWEIELSENATDEYQEFSSDIREKIKKIIDEIKTKPFQGNFGQHPLWEFYDTKNECVIWSAEIDRENRMNYLIFKNINYILIINLSGHNVIDMEYAKQ